MPPLALEVQCGWFFTTVYWWVSMSNNPWCVDSDLLCTNLQTIWDTIYHILYVVADDSVVYNLVRLRLKPFS